MCSCGDFKPKARQAEPPRLSSAIIRSRAGLLGTVGAHRLCWVLSLGTLEISRGSCNFCSECLSRPSTAARGGLNEGIWAMVCLLLAATTRIIPPGGHWVFKDRVQERSIRSKPSWRLFKMAPGQKAPTTTNPYLSTPKRGWSLTADLLWMVKQLQDVDGSPDCCSCLVVSLAFAMQQHLLCVKYPKLTAHSPPLPKPSTCLQSQAA